MDEKPTIFGAPYSVYVRAVRLALEEKGVDYELVPVDIFGPGGPPAEDMARHPSAKIPASRPPWFCLDEAGAITRYIDEVFRRPPLDPGGFCGRARMNQIISVLDSYARSDARVGYLRAARLLARQVASPPTRRG